MKAKLTILLMGLLSLLLIAGPSFAETTMIYDAEDLAAIAENPGGDYVLANSISLGGNWTPLPYFFGTLDGQGHTISGLNIQGGGTEFGVGLFSYYAGTISNLNVTNASITVSAAGDRCVSILGCPGSLDGYNVTSSAAHIINCHVSGTINVSGSGYINASGLIAAENSSADVRISVNGQNMTVAGLRMCRACDYAGNIDVVAENASGSVSAILNSTNCNSRGDICVDVGGGGSNLQVYGIYGQRVDCVSCAADNDVEYRAEDYGSTYATGISGGKSCTFNGKLTANQACAISSSVNCIFSGSMTNCAQAIENVSFISLTDSDSSEGAGNKVSGSVNYTQNQCTNVFFSSTMSPYSRDEMSINFTGAGAASVCIRYGALGTGKETPYATGSVEVSTSSGHIEVTRRVAATGSIACTSDSGSISILGGSYNTGSITAETGGLANVAGGTVFNTGSVSVTAHGKLSWAAGIAEGSNGINRGDVSLTGSCDGDLSAYGVMSANGSYNTGSVTCTNSGSGHATAIGASGSGCINAGSVSASTNEGQCDAGGVSGSGCENQGSVTASGSGELVHAFAYPAGSSGCSNSGHISASNHGPAEATHVANAHGYGGSATATSNDVAYAYGASASASARGQSVSTGQVSWMLYYHHTRKCDCTPATYQTLDSNAKDPSDEYHKYGPIAGAYPDNSSPGSNPTPPDVEMPEKQDPSGDGEVSLKLRAVVDGGYSGEVSSLMWTLGSFSVEGESAHAYYRVSIDVKSQSDKAESWNLVLNIPDGFSSQEWSISQQIPFTASVVPGSSSHYEFPVYALYADSKPSSLAFTVSGDLEGVCTVMVGGNDNEGVVHLRATGGLNSVSSFTEEVPYDPVEDMVRASVNSYRQNLANVTCALTQAIYTENLIKESLGNLGYTDYQFNNTYGDHSVASVFALKKVIVDGKVLCSLMVVIRGTYTTEWIGNFCVDTAYGDNSGYHDDFLNASFDVREHLSYYVLAKNIPLEQTRALVSGHSRAGAVANLVCDWIMKGGLKFRDMTSYTFAAPNSTKTPVEYANIFNILYAGDLVPYVPQGYGKHGRTYAIGFGAQTNPPMVKRLLNEYMQGNAFAPANNDNMVMVGVLAGQHGNDILSKKYVAKAVGNFIAEHPGDSPVARGHGAENYMAWVKGNGISGAITYDDALSKIKADFEERVELAREQWNLEHPNLQNSEFGIYCLTYSTMLTETRTDWLAVMCPVTVEVLDSEGTVLTRMENHTRTYETGEILAFCEGEGDYMVLDSEQTYTLRITGLDNGTMNIGALRLNSDVEALDSDRFSVIPIAKDRTYLLQMNAGSDYAAWVLMADSDDVFFPDSQGDVSYLPASMTAVEKETFAGSGLGGIVVCPAGLTTVEDRAFADSRVTGVYLPPNVQSIAATAFDGLTPVIYCQPGTYAETYAREHGLDAVTLTFPTP